MQDIFGQAVTTSDVEALKAWNRMQLAFLAHAATTPAHLGAALAADPDLGIAHATKGLFLLLLGRRELTADASGALAAARAADARRGLTRRERGYVDALQAFLDGRPSQSVLDLDAILDLHPGDALAMKLGHAIRFVLGDAMGMRGAVERLIPAYAGHPAEGYLKGCHAFALEETGAYAEARVAAIEGLELAPDDAWGLHAVAHVHEMTCDPRGGIDWLDGREAAWAHCNNFRYHVWWHKALMHLDLGQVDVVLDLYDCQIRADRTDDYRDISNAASLLSRLELDGVDVGARWEELAAFSAERTEDGCLIFADLHYLLALIGGGRADAATRLLARIHRDGARACSESDLRMAVPGRAAAMGLEAFGEGDHATAFGNLARARRTMQLAGGSHAQRDVFERITIDAGIRAGFLDEAERILAERGAKRAGGEDGYAAARRKLIDEARRAAHTYAVPAE